MEQFHCRYNLQIVCRQQQRCSVRRPKVLNSGVLERPSSQMDVNEVPNFQKLLAIKGPNNCPTFRALVLTSVTSSLYDSCRRVRIENAQLDRFPSFALRIPSSVGHALRARLTVPILGDKGHKSMSRLLVVVFVR